MHDDAVEALLDAIVDAGLTASSGTEADVVVHGPAGPVLIEVKAMSVGDVDRVRRQVGRYADDAGGQEARMVVLVADQLSEEARDLLRTTDWGYLDRRGALWLRGPGLVVNDTTLAPLERHRPRPDGPIRGRVGLGVALRLLMYPHSRPSVRELATDVDAAPSTVHDALSRLREHALLDRTGEPLMPELFDATAEVWKPERIPVLREPEPDDRDLDLGRHDDETGDVAAHGWVVGGDVGAAAGGARIVVTSGAPPDFYVPNQAILRRTVRRLEQCAYDERGATVAVAPSPVVTAENHYVGSHETPWLHWPLAHPVVVALDLAQDVARGREILDDWSPAGFDRVW